MRSAYEDLIGDRRWKESRFLFNFSNCETRKPVAESGYAFKLISLFTSIVKLTCRRKKGVGKENIEMSGAKC